MAKQTTQPDRAPRMGGPGGGPGGGPRARIIQKPKNLRATVGFLWGYLKKRSGLMFLAFTMVLVNILASLAGTSYLQPIIDNFLDPVAPLPVEARIAGVARGVVVLLCIYLVGVTAVYLQNRLMLSVAQRTINDVRRELFDHLQYLPVRYYDTHTHGELMSRFTNDVDTLSDALGNSLTTFFSSAITLVGILALMLQKSVILTGITLLMTPVMLLVASTLMRISSKYFIAQQQNLGAVNSYVEEMVSGQKEVKVFGREEMAKAEFTRLSQELRTTAATAQGYAGMMMPLSRNINSINYALLATVGGLLSIRGAITVGGLVVFLQLANQFGRPINEVANQYNAVITAIAGAERIQEVLAERPEEPDSPGVYRLERAGRKFFWVCGEERVPLCGEVRFENVTFGYDSSRSILKNISLYANPGQKIAFVGSTGAGKTTVINLITRFYDVNEGSITVDGIPLEQIARDSLRRATGVVLQDTHLFTGTVRENIRYGRLDATDQEVEEAARLASAHPFIKRLPQGYDTVIEGDGANLSQGQRQLLNIARAAIADAPFLILDEATSSVDTRTERQIEKGLDRLMEGRTTFVIAHRLSTVRNSNAILVMEQGEIIERGTHEDLLALEGRYYRLYTGMADLD